METGAERTHSKEAGQGVRAVPHSCGKVGKNYGGERQTAETLSAGN